MTAADSPARQLDRYLQMIVGDRCGDELLEIRYATGDGGMRRRFISIRRLGRGRASDPLALAPHRRLLRSAAALTPRRRPRRRHEHRTSRSWRSTPSTRSTDSSGSPGRRP